MVDQNEIANVIAHALIDDGCTWFRNLDPFDEEGRLQLPVLQESEVIFEPHFAGCCEVPAGELHDIYERRARLAECFDPESPATAKIKELSVKLSQLDEGEPVLASGLMRRGLEHLALFYVVRATGKVLAVLMGSGAPGS